jgi:hypothetical protein
MKPERKQNYSSSKGNKFQLFFTVFKVLNKTNFM